MPAWFNRLTLKLTLAIVAFTVLIAIATALLVTRGFRQTQETAATRSAQALETQGRDNLAALTLREAQLSAAQFSVAARAGQIAAGYLVAAAGRGGAAGDVRRTLSRQADGHYADPAPNRRTDVFIPQAPAITTRQERDLRDSSALDALFPALLAQVRDAVLPGFSVQAQHATAIYYISPHAVARYYPVGSAQFLPFDYLPLQDPSYTEATPAADPSRATIWRAPYINVQQQGLQVTASTPIYAGKEFRGAIGVDVPLTGLLDHLGTLKPTASGYAFLVDRAGGLIAAPPSALPDLAGPDAVPPAISITSMLGISLLGSPNAGFRQTLDAMRAGRHGVSRLDLGGRPVFLSYAPLPGLGWSLGVVAPIAEITQQSAAVANAIHHDANSTILSTLAALGASFALALLATLALSSLLLVRPITALTNATKAIAGGDLRVSLPVTRRDELGELASSFNVMVKELAQFYDVLDQRVRERTHELSTLLEVSRNVTSTLELAPLLDLILDQLRTVVAYTSAAILTLEDEDLVVLKYRGPAPVDLIERLRFPVADAHPHLEVIRSREPVILANVPRDTALTLAYLKETGRIWGDAFGHIRSWMGVPLIHKEQLLGMMVIIHDEPNHYTAHHAQLTAVIAGHATVAIENARLYKQAQELAAFKERSRLARELHDSVSQALYGIALGARTARGLLQRDPARVGEPIDYVLSLAQAGLAEMRALIFELRPESLASEGLIVALNHQVGALRARHELTVHATLCEEPDVQYPLKEAVYRIAQEALHNIVKHAQARTVTLELRCAADALVLVVGDDGTGFDTSGSFPGHLGLRSMQERAAAARGTLSMWSALGAGARIEACFPLS